MGHNFLFLFLLKKPIVYNTILGTVTSVFSLFSVSVFSLFSVLGTVTSNGPSVDSRFFTLVVKDLTFLASASSLGDSCHNT